MAKTKKPKKKAASLETSFFVAQDLATGDWIRDINDQQGFDYTADEDERAWSSDENAVNAFINRLNISNVKVLGQGGNHPPRPPLAP
jgi:hypothetical protein